MYSLTAGFFRRQVSPAASFIKKMIGCTQGKTSADFVADQIYQHLHIFFDGTFRGNAAFIFFSGGRNFDPDPDMAFILQQF